MAKKGKTPSLIGGGAGACNFDVAQRRRICKRCGDSIQKNANCVKVSIPGTMGTKSYCLSCFHDVLAQTQQDLNLLEGQLEELQ